MIDLKKLFESLAAKHKPIYRVIATPDGRWPLNGANQANLIKFTRSLGVYRDNIRGYEIINLNRFSEDQLVL